MRQNKFPISCPVCLSHSREEAALKAESVCSVLSSTDQEVFHRLSWQHAHPKGRPCPAVDCPGYSPVNEVSGRCQCDICGSDWCGLCSSQHEPHQQCVADDTQLNAISVDKPFKRCPSCHHMIEKSEGCNHMVCRCGQEFCFECGKILETAEHFSHFLGECPSVRRQGGVWRELFRQVVEHFCRIVREQQETMFDNFAHFQVFPRPRVGFHSPEPTFHGQRDNDQTRLRQQVGHLQRKQEFRSQQQRYQREQRKHQRQQQRRNNHCRSRNGSTP